MMFIFNVQDTMSAYARSGNFPRFDDGDVVISLTVYSEDTLVLHSHVLSFHSEYFKTGLDAKWLSQNITGTKVIRGREVNVTIMSSNGNPLLSSSEASVDH